MFKKHERRKYIVMKSELKKKLASRESDTREFIRQALIDTVELELTGVLQYMWQSVIAEGLESAEIKAIIREIALKEMEHAEAFANQLNYFGETQIPFTITEVKLSTDPTIQLQHNIETEKEGIEYYETVISTLLQMNTEHGTRRLYENILLDEENHLDEFESLLGKS